MAKFDVLEACRSLTPTELKGCQRLADRIECDMRLIGDYVPAEWKTRQAIALSVIRERIANGR